MSPEAFLGGMAGAFLGVICARVLGAWTVQQTFKRLNRQMRAHEEAIMCCAPNPKHPGAGCSKAVGHEGPHVNGTDIWETADSVRIRP